MAVISYGFRVVALNGNPVEGITFTPAIASPGFVSLFSLPSAIGGTPVALTPSNVIASFIELGQGYYILMFDADAQGADCFALLDAGTNVDPTTRYVGVPLNRDSSRLIQLAFDNAGYVLADVQRLPANAPAGYGIPAGSVYVAPITVTINSYGPTSTQPLIVTEGTTSNPSFQAVNGDGTPINLTGAQLKFMVKKNLQDDDSLAIAQLTKDSNTIGGISISSPTTGVYSLDFNPTDTLNLPLPLGTGYYYGVKMWDGSGNQLEILRGKFTVVPAVIQQTTSP